MLGVLLAIPALTGSAPEAATRPDMVPMFEAIGSAHTPICVMFVNPLIGAIGVLIGGRALRGGNTAVARQPAI